MRSDLAEIIERINEFRTKTQELGKENQKFIERLADAEEQIKSARDRDRWLDGGLARRQANLMTESAQELIASVQELREACDRALRSRRDMVGELRKTSSDTQSLLRARLQWRDGP